MKNRIIIMTLLLAILFSGCSLIERNNLKSTDVFKDIYGVGNIILEYPNILYYSAEPQIGNSDYYNGVWRSASQGSGSREVVELQDSPVADIHYGFHILCTENDQRYTDVAINDIPLVYGETYILSCYAKGNGQLHLQHGKDPWPCVIYDVSDDWTRYSYLFTNGDRDGSTSESPNNNIYIGANAGTSSDLLICGMKLERVHASEWTENPKETQRSS